MVAAECCFDAAEGDRTALASRSAAVPGTFCPGVALPLSWSVILSISQVRPSITAVDLLLEHAKKGVGPFEDAPMWLRPRVPLLQAPRVRAQSACCYLSRPFADRYEGRSGLVIGSSSGASMHAFCSSREEPSSERKDSRLFTRRDLR